MCGQPAVGSPNFVDVWEGVVTFAMFPLLVYVAYLADVADDAPEPELDDSPDASMAVAAVGYGKDGRAISRTDISKVVALKSVEKLSGHEQLQAVASLLLPPQFLLGALLGALAEALVEALAAPHLLRSVAALASPEALRGMPVQALAAPRLPRWASLQAPDEQRQHTHHPPSLLWKRDETPNESSQ